MNAPPYIYVVPMAGTFFVPPQFAHVVAVQPPLLGDFARGIRDESLVATVWTSPPTA